MSVWSVVVVLGLALAGLPGEAPVCPGPPQMERDKVSDPSGDKTGTRVELRFDDTTKYQDLELRWLEIEDSRCPVGVACVWAGQILVIVEVSRGEEEPVEIELVHRIKGPPPMSRAFGFELRLLGVDPHPEEGISPERSDYVAQIEITEP